MHAAQTESSGTWHLVGSRGCGADPDGETIEGPWATIRDHVDRSEGSRCSRCNWPPAR
jgi:hypothetical protein